MRRGAFVRLVLVSGLIGLGIASLGAPGEVPSPEEENPFPPAPEGFSLEDADPEQGREIFLRSCASCHGEDGSGDGRIETDPPARDLRDPERMERFTDWQILSVIRDGGKPYGLSKRMIPWGSMLDDRELRDVTAFVRSLSSGEPEDGETEESEEPGPPAESPDGSAARGS